MLFNGSINVGGASVRSVSGDSVGKRLMMSYHSYMIVHVYLEGGGMCVGERWEPTEEEPGREGGV